jgi:hypothetical protein
MAEGILPTTKRNVPFKLNIQSDSTIVLDSELRATNALESDASRADDFWIAYVLAAYPGSPLSITLRARALTEPRTHRER